MQLSLGWLELIVTGFLFGLGFAIAASVWGWFLGAFRRRKK